MKRDMLYPIIYMVLLTFCIAGFSMSRYKESAGGEDYATVARPVINIKPVSATLTTYDSEVTDIDVSTISTGISLANLQPGDVLVYTFIVRNYDDSGNINQVSLRYKLSTVFDPETATLPLTAEISPTPTDTWISMGYGNQVADTYTLTVSWDSAASDEAYMDQQQNINVKVEAEQVD